MCIRDRRYYSLPVSHSNEEIYGKERTLVTAQSEAWGWMMLENCRDKWDAHCKAKRADSSFKIPKYGKKKTEVHKFFTCKYSNAFSGQKPGWDTAVFKVLDDYNAEIQAFRKKDSKKGWNYFKAVKDLLREANDISEQVPIPTKDNKKRSHAEMAEVDYNESEDESETYSVGSEDSDE